MLKQLNPNNSENEKALLAAIAYFVAKEQPEAALFARLMFEPRHIC